MKGLICRFFHKIDTIDDKYFKERPTGKWVGLFHCSKCNTKYLAYNKRDVLRVVLKEW